MRLTQEIIAAKRDGAELPDDDIRQLIAGLTDGSVSEGQAAAPASAPTAITDVFQTPESVLYDPVADVYLVSNINGDPTAKDNNGFISRIGPDGTVMAAKWIAGGQGDVTLDWGDGSDTTTNPGDGEDVSTHTYAEAGEYTITATDADDDSRTTTQDVTVTDE